jgi:fluoroacetyl-CoA thioesterase
VRSLKEGGDIDGIVTVMSSSASHPVAPAVGLIAGLTATVSLTVADADTATVLRSGDVPVLGTPRLVALCEEASVRSLGNRLGAERTSVASRLQFDHLAPVAVGSTVVAEATLERVEGRRLIFTVAATLRSAERTGLVAAGRLTRVVVDRQAFLAKAGAMAEGSPPKA